MSDIINGLFMFAFTPFYEGFCEEKFDLGKDCHKYGIIAERRTWVI